MIDKTTIIEVILDRLKKLPNGHYLDVRTYKRNRSVLIVKNNEDDILIIEDGYFQDRFHIHINKIKKTLKVLLRREFPRSHKIRIYNMGVFEGEAPGRLKRKII